MVKNDVSFNEWVIPKYKDYSIYACTKRALPHLIDGFKPSQRKIIYTAIRRATSFIKVVSFSGYCVAETGYHHGDASLNEAITLMAKNYTGSNNYPLLTGKGSFGNRFGASASAPRYIYAKISDNYFNFFKKIDEKILLKSDDIENPEPLFYVPIIPYVLLNGVSGIAVGYAVEIPSYNLNNILENIIHILNNDEKEVDVRPYYKGYNGEIIKENGEWIMYGKINRLNTNTLEITEVPINFTTEKYKKVLNNLIDKNIIKDYDDYSDNNWRFIVKVSREFLKNNTDDDLYNIFKLKMVIKENINVVYDNKIIVYDNNVNKLIKDFVKIRLQFYKKRKEYILNTYIEQIVRDFIKFYLNTYIIKKQQKQFIKEEVFEYLTKKFKKIKEYLKKEVNKKIKFDENYFKKIMENIVQNIKFSELYSDKKNKYKENILDNTSKYISLYKKSEIDLYKDDVVELKEKIKG